MKPIFIRIETMFRPRCASEEVLPVFDPAKVIDHKLYLKK